MPRFVLVALSLTFWLLALVGAAFAGDADLQRSLQQAGCIAPDGIKRLWGQGELVAYEVNCSGTSHRIVTVTCGPKTCRVNVLRPDDRVDQG